jgi:hypothetical protein
MSNSTVSTLTTDPNQQLNKENPTAIASYNPLVQAFSIYSASASAQSSMDQDSPDQKASLDASHTTSPWPYLNVIIGGSLIALSGCLLYVKQAIDSVTD